MQSLVWDEGAVPRETEHGLNFMVGLFRPLKQDIGSDTNGSQLMGPQRATGVEVTSVMSQIKTFRKSEPRKGKCFRNCDEKGTHGGQGGFQVELVFGAQTQVPRTVEGTAGPVEVTAGPVEVTA